MEAIRRTAADAQVFVLNGDIFDFKWSEHGVFSSSVVAARRFLTALAESAPSCRFKIILGNHDAVPPYVDALRELTATHENIEWDEFVCLVEDRLFLHGDVIHAGRSNSAVRRFRGRLSKPANGHTLQRLAHSAVHRSRVPWAAYKVLPKRILASRILAYLEHEDFLNGQPVRHVYFGHTHHDFEDFRYRGYTFHN